MIGFFNGEFIPIDQKAFPIEERGHQFGDGVYEVIRVYGGEPFLLREHLERLGKSAAAIRLTPNYSPVEIEAIILEGIRRAGLLEADVYLQITRGIAPRQHLFPHVPASTSMTVRPARIIADSLREHGVSITLKEDERWANCYIKSLNLLPNILAKQAAANAGFYEAVFVKDGWVTEGSSSNIFAVQNGVLYTPPATRKILHGVTRGAILRLAAELGIAVRQEEFSPQFLQMSDEVFITSTSIEAMPVSSIDEHIVGMGRPGAVTRELQQAYRRLVEARRRRS